MSRNTAKFDGGIAADGYDGMNTTLIGTTVSGNPASDGYGGGIGLSNGLAVGMSILNSTISGNTAAKSGGGVSLAGAWLIATHTTVAGNSASIGGGGIDTVVEGSRSPAGRLTLSGSILALNQSSSGASPDCIGTPLTVTLTGSNLLGNPTGCGFSGTPPIIGNPSLGPLANNGGPTETHALLPGSPALNAGDPAACAAGPVNGVDQRGIMRPQGAGCDLGAYEATAVGGRHLRISAEPGQVALGWDSGFSQTGYTLLTYNTTTAGADLTPLMPNPVTYTDSVVSNGVMYCYAVAPTRPGGGVLGVSDLECALPGSRSGTVNPEGFTLIFHGTPSASLSWTAPVGGADSYLLQRIPLDGTPPSAVQLAGVATSAANAVTTAGTCFQIIAFKGMGFGTSDVLCGIPGLSTLAVGAKAGRTAGDVMAEVIDRLTGLQLPVVAAELREVLPAE